MERDVTLDRLRGIAVIDVVFGHVLFWLGFFATGYSAVIKSFLLFEMPVFFFVTGAVNGRKNNISYRSFVLKRIKGILIPYYVYSAICVVISSVYYIVNNKFSLNLFIKILLTWLIPLDQQIMPLRLLDRTLWFVPVYIIIIIMFPLMMKVISKIGGYAVILSIVIYVAVLIADNCFVKYTDLTGFAGYFYKIAEIIHEAAFYMIFTALGVFYPALKKSTVKKRIISAIVLAVSISGLLICKYLLGNSPYMQFNKFPPNRMFFFFSFAFASAVYLLYPVLKKAYLFLVRMIPSLDAAVLYFSYNSIYVFLYQSFAFLLMLNILESVGIKNDWLGFAISFIIVFPLVYLTVKIINRIRSLTVKN